MSTRASSVNEQALAAGVDNRTESETIDIPRLDLVASIGFNGKVPGGLLVHPDKQHLIYPLGCTVVIEEIGARHNQFFLSEHTNDITCIAVSKSGRYIASGQVTYMGFKADIIVWDYETKEVYAKFTLHKVKVEALAFSPGELYLVSLGGQDDGSVVIWDLARKEPVCGSPAQVESAGTTLCVKYCHNSDDKFVTAGEYSIRVWRLDRPNRKIYPTEVDVGKVKRIIRCLEIDPNDMYCYCGTSSGDVMSVNINTCLFQALGPEKSKFSLGVTAVKILKNGGILVGAGSGEIVLCKGPQDKFKPIKDRNVKINGAVSSLALRGEGHHFYVGDSKSHIYRFLLTEFKSELINSCHSSAVNDIQFPYGTSELFATCSFEDIRVWHLPTSKELLRIVVPNMTCSSISFMRDGHSIMSAWDDGKIRAFTPETGKILYTIHDAHNKGVTAIATTSDSKRIISGGGEGQVRVWEVSSGLVGGHHGAGPGRFGGPEEVITHKMIEAMKEHKGSVSCIRVRSNDNECVSSSTDGTCIIWDLQRFTRSQIIFANTLFKCVAYRPDECQIVTSGTDRKLGYWETYDGALIRELEASKTGSVNGLDVDNSGEVLVTVGDDRLVKAWQYNEGTVTHVGLGHSDAIMRVRICPNSRHIITVSADGAILRWNFPLLTMPSNGFHPS